MVNPNTNRHYNRHILVVDTDTYAGNFEREMCAFMTGQIGKCGVGEDQARVAQREIPRVVAQLGDLVDQVMDEQGCHRPVSVFQNQKYGNDGKGNHAVLTAENKDRYPWPAYNSVGIYFGEIPNSRLLSAMKKRAREFADREQVKIEGFRFLGQQTTFRELKI